MRSLSLWFLGVAGALCAAISPALSNPPDPDWRRVLKGVDGVIVYCLTSKDRDYSVEICGKLARATTDAFEGSRLAAIHTGVAYTGIDVQANDPKDPTPLKQAPGIKSPLLIRLLIKGTRGSEPGISGTISVSRPFVAAIESGASSDGVAGDLVVHERHWVGHGPRRRVIGVVLDHGTKQVRDLVADIRSHL